MGRLMNVLVIDVGGTHVKILATGQSDKREFASGPKMTAATDGLGRPEARRRVEL